MKGVQEGRGSMTEYRGPRPAILLPNLSPKLRRGSWTGEDPHPRGLGLGLGYHGVMSLFIGGDEEAWRGEVTCPRSHRMRARARVGSNMSCFPDQCFVHKGCFRVKTICQRSLEEERGGER